MSDEPDNLVLVYLRRLAAGQDAIREDVREIKLRLTTVETLVGTMVATEMSHYAITSERLDRLGTRMERIEARLDLREGV